MKKKVFSLMMMLLLAFTGFVRADELTVHDGTATNAYVPVYGFYADAYLKCEMVYPASELSAMNGGQISSMAFGINSPATEAWTATFEVFVKEVSDATISDFTGTTGATTVYTGTLDGTGSTMTVNFTAPYTYNGGNLLVGFYLTTTGNYKSITWAGETVNGASVQGYNYSSLSSVTATQRDFLPKTTFTYTTGGSGGGGGSMEDQLHVKYMEGEEEIIDSLNLGVRPAGAWMEPFTFTMYSEGPTYTVNVLDFTPSDGMFSVEGEELPFQVNTDGVELVMNVNTADTGVIERQFVAITEGDRAAHIWPVVVELYAPEVPDVWELACEEATTFPFVEVPQTAHNMQLHNDYTLPFPEIPEGYDAVYKLVFDQDVMLNASVTQGENGKVALYREGFEGEGGPMADNYYTGPSANGGGATGGSFEAMIGDETSTTTSTYFPFHTLWNYSIGENLFLASELTEAGVTTAPMTSLSWYVSSTTCTTPQNGISIWMANVSDSELTATSHTTAGMTLVYTGANVLPVAGEWNEFVFNAGNFAWDGHSNVLVVCQRLNGSWQGSVSWQTHNPGFTAMTYDYDDYEVYDMTSQTYSMYTSATNRANIIFKGNSRASVNNFTYNFEAGVAGWTDIDNDGDGHTWFHSSNSMNESGYDYTGFGHNTSDGFMVSASYCDITYDYYDADNYLVSPQKYTLGDNASVNFFFDYANDSYPDYFEVCVATADNPGASDFTSIWNVNMRGGRAEKAQIRHSNNRYENWREVTVDLSAYAGQDVWVAFHHQDIDYYEVWIDDVTINTGSAEPTPGPTPAGEMAYGPEIINAAVEAGTYYLVASSTDADLEVTINAEDMPCPTVEAEGFAFNPTPADDADEVEPASVTLRWNIPAYATGWRLVFGSTYYPDPNHPQTIMYPEDGSFATTLANSYTVTNLWNNTNYFWHVEFNNDGCPEGVSSPIWGFTTHLNIPTNLTAVDYTVFDDEQIVLNWNAVVDRTYRFYNVYRDGELIGNTQVNNISNTTYTDGPLEYNMEGYTYYVTAVYDEGESAPSDPVTVKVSGYGDVNGHVYEQDGTTGIAGATVTMVGQDEFGVNHTYNFTTNAQGYYTGHIYAGPAYDGQAAKDGYQTAYVPVQGEPIVITYNQTTSPIDYILDENFDPVCGVIAEYYPDSLDPNSPYVKVYWGCGLPGSEIIEPFETGDFSLFDWQVDPTYPWTITTTNPYEGTYCMKSGGAGVANVVSNMTVTVNIPADGLMSFFGKISCESSWDYGYFYIDGVQKGSYTGAGNWAEKVFDITAGDHTFQWRYTKDGSVNSNDDCFYVDYITFYKQPAPPVPGMTYDFEDHTMQGWTSVDADGDGYGWRVGSELMSGVAGHNSSEDFVFSQSYDNSYGVLYPDNYLVSPQVQLGGLVRFYACAQDAGYAAEHFGVAVSTTNTNPSSFTMVQEWTMSAKSVAAPAGKPIKGQRSGREQGNWYEYTVDLSAYSGNGYVAIRHFNCSDMFYLDVDDITIGEPGKGIAETRSLDHYRVYRTNCYNDGPYTLENTVLLASVWVPDTVYIDVEWADLEPGVYKWGVGSVYSGNRGEEIEGEINWSEPINVNTNRDMTVDFESGMPAGWTVIDANNDGWTWTLTSDIPTTWTYYSSLTLDWYHGGSNAICSGSYINGVGALNPDEYLVSPQVNLGAGSSISFWVAATDASYAADHFGVFVSDNGTSNWTSVQEWTLSGSKSGLMGGSASRDGEGLRLGTWFNYTVDLSAFDGQKYVAFRHFNCYDQYIMCLDDITIVEGAGGPTPPTPPTPGSNDLQLPRESEIVWSNCLDKDMWLNGVTVNVLLNSADSPEGTTVDFTNLNEVEQQNYPVSQVVLDESGYYAFESFRRGEYAVRVRHEGYEPIDDTVSIWSDTDLRYVMIEIIYGVGDIYVSRTGWAMWEGEMPVGPTPGPNPGGNTSFSDDFEGGLGNWNLVDADGDGHNWYHSSQSQTYACYDYTGWGHNESDGFAVSSSYTDCTYDSYDPNNFMITNQKYSITSSSVLNFWADYGNDSYPDHFGVAVATADNPTPADFTIVWEGSAKSGNAGKSQVRHNGDRYFNWRSHSVDLSAYAGQDVYIAFRHFNSYDQYEIYIDDVELTAGAKSGDRHFEYYKVMCTSIDGVPIFNHNTVYPFCQLSTDEPYNAPLVEGEHYLCKVARVYTTGMSPWSEPVEWVYEPCDHWGPVDEVTVGTSTQGNHVEWVFEHGFNPYAPEGSGQGGDASSFMEDCDAGMPAGWTNIDADGDGNVWVSSMTPGIYHNSGVDLTGTGHNASTAYVISGSYANQTGAVLYPDNYLVSPEVTLGGSFSFFACAQDASYAAEHFGVAVSTNGSTSAADFTTLQEWTLTAKNVGSVMSAGRSGANRAQGNWYQYTVDLSAYEGQTGYVAIRHFNCHDQFILNVDDISMNAENGAKGGEIGSAQPYQMVGANLEFNLNSIPNYNERVYFLYNLYQDSRFDVVNAETTGRFLVSADEAYTDLDVEEAFNDFREQNAAQFAMIDKVQAAQLAGELKPALPSEFMQSLFTYDYIRSRENDMCATSDPICSDSTYFFPAPVGSQTSESGPDYDCLYTQPRPVWYHFRIADPGAIQIYMHSNPQIDIDFCCWGPFDDPVTPCPYGLTEDKVVSCSYSASWNETCDIPATAQTGEYYILVITNYNGGATNITFSQTGGSGTTDCGIVPSTDVDILGFLITQDGEYDTIVGPDVREYTDFGEFGEHEYCVRPIYPGLAQLPDSNFYFSMGCPVCMSTNGEIIETCDPGNAIYAEVNNTDDQVRIYWDEQPEPPTPAEGTTFVYDFENSSLDGLTLIDADGDGNNWMLASVAMSTGYGHNASVDMILSKSYDNNTGVLYPDNYIVFPIATIVEGSTFSFWGCGQDAGYVAEHFGVAVSTDGTNFTTIQEWTMAGKGAAKGVRDGRDQGTWHQFSVDLSDYAGQEIYIALRHFNCSDMFYLDIDDVELSIAAKSTRDEIVGYNIYRSTDGINYDLIATVGADVYEYFDAPGAGTYYYQVTAVYASGCESEPAVSGINPEENFVVVGVTGVGEDNDNVNLFPNPTKGNVTIQAKDMNRITVVSVLGQVVFDTELDQDEYILNMAQFTNGMYMVRIYTDGGVTVKRVTVMH